MVSWWAKNTPFLNSFFLFVMMNQNLNTILIAHNLVIGLEKSTKMTRLSDSGIKISVLTYMYFLQHRKAKLNQVKHLCLNTSTSCCTKWGLKCYKCEIQNWQIIEDGVSIYLIEKNDLICHDIWQNMERTVKLFLQMAIWDSSTVYK